MDPSLTIVRPADEAAEPLAIAFRHATAERIAVLGAAYEPAATWERAAAESTASILCGPVLPGPFRDGWSWAYYLCEYSHVCSRPLRVEARHIVAGNAVYRRRDVEAAWFQTPAGEVALHARMLSAGLAAEWSGDLAVHLRAPASLGEYVRQRRRRSRDWAQARRMPVLALPVRLLIVPGLVWRTLRAAAPRWPLQWFRALPWILVAASIRAACDFGAALGPRRDTFRGWCA